MVVLPHGAQFLFAMKQAHPDGISDSIFSIGAAFTRSIRASRIVAEKGVPCAVLSWPSYANKFIEKTFGTLRVSARFSASPHWFCDGFAKTLKTLMSSSCIASFSSRNPVACQRIPDGECAENSVFLLVCLWTWKPRDFKSWQAYCVASFGKIFFGLCRKKDSAGRSERNTFSTALST
jgi:hypothetical protein